MENSTAVNRRLKLLFITQEDPFYIRIFFEEFLRTYPYREEIIGVVICSTMGKKSPFKLIKQMYSFYGLMDFMRMLWRYVLVKLQGNTLANTLKAYSIPFYAYNDINSEEFVNFWHTKGLDVIISVAAPKIFKEKLLSLPKWGCINIHHAKLPFYKGMMPNFWQMYHGEKSAGITVHSMNAKIDEGEIIIQREVPIETYDSLDSLIKDTKRVGAHYIMEVIESIRGGKVTYMPKSKEAGSYFTFPTKAEVREFRRRGKRII